MSYCRFSSDDFKCDVYCYESDSGFITHVANNRICCNYTLPSVVPLDAEHLDEYVERQQIVMELVEKSDRVPIGLPYDGKTFSDATAAEAADRLQSLKDIGYCVPQYAIDALREGAA